MTINLYYYLYIYIFILLCFISAIFLLLSFKSLIKISIYLSPIFAVIVIMFLLLNIEVLKLFPLIQRLYILILAFTLQYKIIQKVLKSLHRDNSIKNIRMNQKFSILIIYKNLKINLLFFSVMCNIALKIALNIAFKKKKVLRSQKYTRRVLPGKYLLLGIWCVGLLFIVIHRETLSWIFFAN